MDLRRCVEIEVLDGNGALLLVEIFPNGRWYDELHPLIDSDLERKRLQVQCIKGRQFDTNGQIMKSWESIYATDGTIISLTDTYPDGSVETTTWNSDRSIDISRTNRE